MNLGCAGASKAQERVQNLAHGHPRGVGCSLTVVVLSLVHAGSLGVTAHRSIEVRGTGWRVNLVPTDSPHRSTA